MAKETIENTNEMLRFIAESMHMSRVTLEFQGPEQAEYFRGFVAAFFRDVRIVEPEPQRKSRRRR